MAPQSSFRGVATVQAHEVESYDEQGRPIISPLASIKHLTRATCIIPRYDRLTPIIAYDCEMQGVRIAGRPKEIKRAGRLSYVNELREVVLDVFVYYDPKTGWQVTLPPRSMRFGVYWEDIKPENGALPIDEVEYHIRQIMKGRIVVGHAIDNDIKVLSKGVFDGIKVRDTQLHEPYRVYGKGRARLPKLKVLAEEVLGREIQGDEHSSVEDAQATMDLYLRNREAFEAAQGDWKVEPGSRWGELGLVNENYANVIDEDEEEDGVDEVYEIANTSNLAKLPLSQAGSFWKNGSSAVKATCQPSFSITPKAAMSLRRPSMVPSDASGSRTSRTSSLATSGASTRQNSPTASLRSSLTSVSSFGSDIFSPGQIQSSTKQNTTPEEVKSVKQAEAAQQPKIPQKPTYAQMAGLTDETTDTQELTTQKPTIQKPPTQKPTIQKPTIQESTIAPMPFAEEKITSTQKLIIYKKPTNITPKPAVSPKPSTVKTVTPQLSASANIWAQFRSKNVAAETKSAGMVSDLAPNIKTFALRAKKAAA